MDIESHINKVYNINVNRYNYESFYEKFLYPMSIIIRAYIIWKLSSFFSFSHDGEHLGRDLIVY